MGRRRLRRQVRLVQLDHGGHGGDFPVGRHVEFRRRRRAGLAGLAVDPDRGHGDVLLGRNLIQELPKFNGNTSLSTAGLAGRRTVPAPQT